ncbi:VWA domain-containing protein [Brumimicrobium glaciale]|uniref:VWA domain-containing protein n=1 Tax=Brumimicrobium glaciale TaxID=200475 RepID=A0A4Q4KRN1_9FLAO|nr:VWA domain-containing protein [Brumimicrobium glaciale]RYM35963.1 VWA domain-containing protein [Brumimicrobium glaciale]
MPKRKLTYTYRLPFFTGFVLGFEFMFWIIMWQLMSIFGVFSPESSAEILSFLHPKFAWLFVLLPILMIVFFYQLFKRNQLVNNIGSINTLHTFLKPVATRKVFWRYFLIRNAVVFIIFALMQPALGTKNVQGQSNGIELIFAVDISNSMNTRDIQGGETRLEVAKRAMNQLVNQSAAARVGLLVFAGSAYPQLPLTADKEAAKMYIDELNTSFISNQGTNVAAALKESSRFFSKQRTKKVLILITDGEDHEGGLKEAYKAIKNKNIEVLILGIGTEKGGIVPRDESPNSVSLKDELGRSVISKVNLTMLEEIANNLNGDVILSNESFPNVSKFLTQINSKSSDNLVNLDFKVKENRYQWPLSIAILSILLLFIGESIPKPKNNSNDA